MRWIPKMIMALTYRLPFRLYLGWGPGLSWDDSCSSSICFLLKIACIAYFGLVSDKKLKNCLGLEISPLLGDGTCSLRVGHDYRENVKIKSYYSSSSNVDKSSLCQPDIIVPIAHRWEKFKLRRMLFRQHIQMWINIQWISHTACYRTGSNNVRS